MGVIRLVLPLDTMLVNWLDELRIVHPPISRRSSAPTPNDVRFAIAAINGCTFTECRNKESHTIYMDIWSPDGTGTEACLSGIESEDSPCKLSFHKGCDELVLKVVQSLSKSCGTLVIVEDTGDKPMVVASDST
jgi:hypothetical protein